MARVQTVDRGSQDANRLVEINNAGNNLVVRKLSAPYQTRLTVVAALFLLAAILLAIAITASRELPQFRIFLFIFGVAMSLAALRLFDIRLYSAREEAYLFDKTADALTRNSEELAKLTEVDHVLVRRIRRDDDEDPERSDYALVVALQNTKRFTLAESDGVAGARGQIMSAAEQIASYLDVPIKEGERLPTEYWMDR